VNLVEMLDEVASGLPSVERLETGTSVEWRRGSRAFAVAGADHGEFRLDVAVARAATRTPDTETSPRGAGWITFVPAVLDGHATDRAEAWFASAWRLAEHR